MKGQANGGKLERPLAVRLERPLAVRLERSQRKRLFDRNAPPGQAAAGSRLRTWARQLWRWVRVRVISTIIGPSSFCAAGVAGGVLPFPPYYTTEGYPGRKPAADSVPSDKLPQIVA